MVLTYFVSWYMNSVEWVFAIVNTVYWIHIWIKNYSTLSSLTKILLLLFEHCRLNQNVFENSTRRNWLWSTIVASSQTVSCSSKIKRLFILILWECEWVKCEMEKMEKKMAKGKTSSTFIHFAITSFYQAMCYCNVYIVDNRNSVQTKLEQSKA